LYFSLTLHLKLQIQTPTDMTRCLSLQRTGTKGRNYPRKNLKGVFSLKNDHIKSGSSYSTD